MPSYHQPNPKRHTSAPLQKEIRPALADSDSGPVDAESTGPGGNPAFRRPPGKPRSRRQAAWEATVTAPGLTAPEGSARSLRLGSLACGASCPAAPAAAPAGRGGTSLLFSDPMLRPVRASPSRGLSRLLVAVAQQPGFFTGVTAPAGSSPWGELGRVPLRVASSVNMLFQKK